MEKTDNYNILAEFDGYKILGEPQKKEKSELWTAAIGLQQVDGLTPSRYLLDAAKQNIEGEISIYQLKERLNEYYKANRVSPTDRTEEADKVSAHIAEVLSENAFTLSPGELICVHKRLFSGVLPHAGLVRDYNISKAEWVLNGESVFYAAANSILSTLSYDFDREKELSYKGLSKNQTVERIAKFISGIWQIHPFGEGNTRTTAVFAIKYLRFMGFSASNDMFAHNSWYFRNALVRANYSNVKNNVFATDEYLIRFFENLLLDGKHMLKNRDLIL